MTLAAAQTEGKREEMRERGMRAPWGNSVRLRPRGNATQTRNPAQMGQTWGRLTREVAEFVARGRARADAPMD